MAAEYGSSSPLLKSFITANDSPASASQVLSSSSQFFASIAPGSGASVSAEDTRRAKTCSDRIRPIKVNRKTLSLFEAEDLPHLIHNLGTLREWRKRGVASALITWSLHAFAQNGFTHAMLGVDADNPTSAAHLYRDLGFELERRSTTREVELGAH